MRNVTKAWQGLLLGFFLFLCQSSAVLAGIQCYARDSYSVNFILAVQETLQANDLDPGPIDGLWGRRTEGALAAFQHKKGLSVTHDLNEPTLRALFGEDFDAGKYGLEPSPAMPADIFDEHCR